MSFTHGKVASIFNTNAIFEQIRSLAEVQQQATGRQKLPLGAVNNQRGWLQVQVRWPVADNRRRC